MTWRACQATGFEALRGDRAGQYSIRINAQWRICFRWDDDGPDVGFQARMMALCSLPRTNPGNQVRYVRRNGPYTLVMTAAGATPKLPYGSLARLLMAWVSTEAVRTQSPELVLGHSLTEFMNDLGIKHTDSAGRRGERTRLRNQMDRLFNAAVHFAYEPTAPDGTSLGVKDTFGSTVARKTHLVWNPKKPNEPVLWQSTAESATAP